MRCIAVPAFIGLLLLSILSCGPQARTGKQETKAHQPAPVEVQAQVDKANATVGDLITFTITVTSEPQLAVHIPEAGSQIAGLRIVDIGDEGPSVVDNRTLLKKWWKLQPDLSGTYIIPSMTVSYRDAAGKEQGIATAQMFIEVTSGLKEKKPGEAGDIIDIKPLQEIAQPITPLMRYGALFIILVLCGLVLFLYLRKKSKSPPGVPKPAYVQALEELEQLARDQLVERGVVREYYFRLSEIFRRYLERRFHIPAVERTTEELLPDLANLQGYGSSVKTDAREFLRHADLVKFAKYAPGKEEVERGYQKVISIIKETKEDIQNQTGADAPAPEGGSRH